MGYDTHFEGAVTVVPPLNAHEIGYLRRFAESRRMDRELGPYYCDAGYTGIDIAPDVLNHNAPGFDQPGLWCKWSPTDDGGRIQWNQWEKFYDAELWMAYVVRTFLMPGAVLAEELASRVEGRYYAPEFAHFTFDHVVNGVIDAQGEEPDDVWQLVVTDNVVTVRTDGEASGPITDTSPGSAPQLGPGLVAAVLAGGPYDGRTLHMPLEDVPGGLTMQDGSHYAPDVAGDPEIEDGAVILRFQQG